MTFQSGTNQARDVAHYLHPYTNLAVHEQEGPLVITRGDGCYVYDEAGNRYLESLSGLFCASLGFSEGRLADAADRQMRKLPFYHAFGQKSTDVGIELAEKLISMAPVPMSKVFFANSGSEANDTAIKLVWYYHNAVGKPRKKKIISRQKAYHGVTVAAASLTGLPYAHREFDLPIERIVHADCPHFYRSAQPGESEEDYATRCADALEQLILKEGPDEVGAFFAEPVMGSAGVIVPPRTYFEKVQKVLKKYDVLFIADEVICAFARTGNMFGSQTYDLRPDMVTLAKQLSAGYQPISALMINDRIYRALVEQSRKVGTFGHGYTYTGHPVAAAVALETLRIYEDLDIVARVRELMPVFHAHLQRLGEHPLIGEARGVGLLGGLEVSMNKARREAFAPAAGVAGYAAKRALAHGVITRGLNDTVTLCPPLIITRAELDEMFDGIGRALDDTYAWASQQGLMAA
ncbi:aspartate aminotransferase family protein [Paraburkholderia haematera]|uniref:Putrescine--pyruvate aminotransferase n=1 Tax=Paraburkholderia haematera TaxID=2793077 RepID=A0ABN7KYT3_9BURK|nr:aspartate aminotransferase family protein [Paraburkholderia haematera]CAE6717440.1 Putrescine--pyruvate aminotransferase [Paraburkholderia haematera]